ncbi:alpha/beta hydrolase fold domain-containing protein [Sphingobium baderi]|uniref:alpha/beta hydrolase fold domain-containing protein n=1 Tax=Sphingobium baderi TaxID=1332080 RepID=UPI002B40A779|nr:alpha/beta hydrolase fold domain-containing protein [Sphingobium baderi]
MAGHAANAAGRLKEDCTMALRSRYPLDPRRTGRPAPAALVETRDAITGAVSPYTLAEGAMVAERTVGGVRCIVASPRQPALGGMIYFHGGGYRLGGPDRMAGFLSRLAADGGCRVIAPAYALAPENPYPAALHDAAAVIDAVAAEAPDVPMMIGGDSAGGGLAAACCIAFGESLPSLRGAVLLSPWLDLRVCADSFERCAPSDRLFSRESAQDAANSYLQGLPADAPLASPLLAGALDGMPSTLIIAGSAEVLIQDSIDFAARLAAQHIGVELSVIPHMQHVSPTLFPDLPSSARSLSAITRFMRERLNGTGLIADPQS